MNDIKLTLPNGVVLSGFDSPSEVLDFANGVATTTAEEDEVRDEIEDKIIEKLEEKESVEKKRKSKKTFHTKTPWTMEENKFLISNLEKKANFLVRSFLADNHTEGAIKNRYYTIVSNRYQDTNGFTPEIISMVKEKEAEMKAESVENIMGENY